MLAVHKGKVLLLDEVSSTQDAAIEHELQSGDVCVSFNQTSGRGRRGNFWDGTGGVAVTVVLDSIQPHIPIAVAVTLAGQLNNLIPHATVGIKWPNDLLVNGKKLAGILIEQRQGRYLVGIGVNVLASPLPTSTSLNEIGAESNLENVAELVASSVFDASELDENTAVTTWRKRDILVGTMQTVRSGDNIVEGMVLRIDPCHNLVLQTSVSILKIPAASATIVTP